MERVATFLLEMDRRLAVAGMMALPMCRRDIGDYLGLTLETVSRALSQLHAQGVLGFSGARQIVLRNRSACAAWMRKSYYHLRRRVSGITSQIMARPAAATAASPRNAKLLPKRSAT